MDVVMLSRADTPVLRQMTQTAVNTCIMGAPRGSVNIIVLEQIPGVRYRHAHTVRAPEEFAYNKFANIGARMGSAPWIMVANNDLRFAPGWLQPLLTAHNAVVSPKDPFNRFQRAFARNMVGGHVGRTFSGWCFAITRDLWERMGGFDEDFTFWCADDAVVEQVKAFGIQPMLVVNSHVHHLTSITHRQTADPDGARTWAQVYKFEQKYGVKKFHRNAAYLRWKIENGVMS